MSLVFYFLTFIFKVKFWIYKVHVGNVYFFLKIIHFQHWKNKDKYLTIQQQSWVRIPQQLAFPSWQHKLASLTSQQPKLAAQVSSQSWQHKFAAKAGSTSQQHWLACIILALFYLDLQISTIVIHVAQLSGRVLTW